MQCPQYLIKLSFASNSCFRPSASWSNHHLHVLQFLNWSTSACSHCCKFQQFDSEWHCESWEFAYFILWIQRGTCSVVDKSPFHQKLRNHCYLSASRVQQLALATPCNLANENAGTKRYTSVRTLYTISYKFMNYICVLRHVISNLTQYQQLFLHPQ